jgi:hypothetical protein
LRGWGLKKHGLQLANRGFYDGLAGASGLIAYT